MSRHRRAVTLLPRVESVGTGVTIKIFKAV
jgi:hypothetical protein